jgi:hypothetical protein
VWATADKFIAAVNGSGAVTGTGPGNTKVTATVDGMSASAAIVVQYSTSAVDHVIVQLADAEIQVAAKTTAIAILQDALGYALHGRAVAWSTSNPTVATVDPTGKVTGIGTGTVMIRATSEGKYGEAPLVVVAAPWVPGEQQPLVDPSRGAWEIGPYGHDEVMAQSFKPTVDQWLGYIAFPVYCTEGVKISVVIKEGSFFGPVLWSGQMAGLPKTRTGQFIQIQILNPSTMPNGIRLKANTSYYVELAAVRPHGVWSNCGISKGPRSDTYARGSGYWQQPSPWFHPLPFGEDLPFITYVR